MRVIPVIAFILCFHVSLYSQTQRNKFYRQIFSDSVISTVLNAINEIKPNKIFLIAKSDTWQYRRFYQVPLKNGQHSEGMNLYAYTDKYISSLIDPPTWSIIAHDALFQVSQYLKYKDSDVVLIKDISRFTDNILFSVTLPVKRRNYAFVDLTYYKRAEGNDLYGQWFQGQALIMFKRVSKGNWKICNIVNHFIL